MFSWRYFSTPPYYHRVNPCKARPPEDSGVHRPSSRQSKLCTRTSPPLPSPPLSLLPFSFFLAALSRLSPPSLLFPLLLRSSSSSSPPLSSPASDHSTRCAAWHTQPSGLNTPLHADSLSFYFFLLPPHTLSPPSSFLFSPFSFLPYLSFLFLMMGSYSPWLYQVCTRQMLRYHEYWKLLNQIDT